MSDFIPSTDEVGTIQPSGAPWADISLRMKSRRRIRQNPSDEEIDEAAVASYELEPVALIVRKVLPRMINLAEASGDSALKIIGDEIEKLILNLKQKMSQPNWPRTKSGKAPKGVDWLECSQITLDWIRGGVLNSEPPCDIFMKGNVKLPYQCFSTLPAITCPSAGYCLNKKADGSMSDNQRFLGGTGAKGWCYSFKGWRYPATFYRQLINTILIRISDKRHILNDIERILKSHNTRLKKLKKAPNSQPLIVRLYVDGDMDSVETIDFWMQTLRKYPMISAYGYSKSWSLFIKYDKMINGNWPSNYVLNLSGGSKFDADYEGGKNSMVGKDSYVDLMKRLPIVRGEFIAVPIKGDPAPTSIRENLLTPDQKKDFQEDKIPVGLTDYHFKRNPEYTNAVGNAAKAYLTARGMNPNRYFVCPSKCGNCVGTQDSKLVGVKTRKLKDGQTMQIGVLNVQGGTTHACGLKKANIPIFIGTH